MPEGSLKLGRSLHRDRCGLLMHLGRLLCKVDAVPVRDRVPAVLESFRYTLLVNPHGAARSGYVRASNLAQGLNVQFARLKADGCGIIRSEKVSGGSCEDGAELATIIEFLRPGDEIVVTRLDRLGRDTHDGLTDSLGRAARGVRERARHGGPDGMMIHQGAPA